MEYDGSKITYDEIGNPLAYRDGFMFQWEKGKMLSSVKNSKNKIDYAYNSNGIRIRKNVNGTITNYNVDGNKIISEKTGKELKWYFYDENENVIAYQKGEKMYYFEKDKLNNIIGIYNDKGEKVVGYSYDAWGNLLSISGDKELGNNNPFRYRSYYYDAETGFYYLRTRYYDSITKRFLNTDSILGANGGENAYNLFHYCCNNPVKYEDPSGNWVVSVGVEANAAAIFGAYGSMQISFDDKTRFNISYSFGATIVFDVAAGISGFICVFPNFSNVSQVGGWAFATGVSFSVGVAGPISVGGGGGITIAQDTIAPYVNVSLQAGVSLIKLPTLYVRVGYTWIKGGFNVKNIIKSYKKGQKKKYTTKHGDVFIKKVNEKYIEVYTSDIERKARLYKNGKMKILKK